MLQNERILMTKIIDVIKKVLKNEINIKEFQVVEIIKDYKIKNIDLMIFKCDDIIGQCHINKDINNVKIVLENAPDLELRKNLETKINEKIREDF